MTKPSKILLISSFSLIIVIGIILAVALKKSKQSEFTYITAEKTDLTQEVSVIGRIKPEQSVDLSFESAGKVSRVYVEVGNTVDKGQILITIDNTELKAQLEQAKAQLEADQIKLDELKKGARQEEIDIAETTLTNAEKELVNAEINLTNTQNKAETDLENLYSDVSDILHDAYAVADDAVTKQTDEMFNNDSTDSPQLTFTTSDNQTKTDAEWQRVLSRYALADFKQELMNLSTEHSALDTVLTNTENYLEIIRDFLTKLNDALNTATNVAQSTINTYKGYVNTARTNIISEMTSNNSQKQSIATQKVINQQNISTAESKITTAQNTLESAQKELALKQAGATQEQIKAQSALVNYARANVQNINAKIAKTVLYSPISGIVTQQEAKQGEIISANTVIASVISKSKYKIEANVPEVDIAKIKINNPAKITFDAYHSDVIFLAEVIKIDPAETMIEGVATYKVTLKFTEENENIKPGMTADIDILTAKKENIIAVPARAVISQNGKKFVRILCYSNNIPSIEETSVEVGIRGSDGNIEIISGVQEGDKVITLFAPFRN